MVFLASPQFIACHLASRIQLIHVDSVTIRENQFSLAAFSHGVLGKIAFQVYVRIHHHVYLAVGVSLDCRVQENRLMKQAIGSSTQCCRHVNHIVGNSGEALGFKPFTRFRAVALLCNDVLRLRKILGHRGYAGSHIATPVRVPGIAKSGNNDKIFHRYINYIIV